MNQLTKVFEGQEVRVVGTPEQPLFVLADVCKVLDIGNPSDVKRRLEDGVDSIEVISDSVGRSRNTVVINEDGLYDVILDSRKAQAKRFRKWVTSDVLPSIRKDGGYIVVNQGESEEDILARGFLIAKKRIEQLQREKQALLHSGKLYTSTEIAKELGFKSANALNKMLEEQGIQYYVNKTWVLKANYADKGYTSIKQTILESGKAVYDRKWTGVGREFLINKFSMEG